MKLLETSLFAATLVLVPALAWFVGRAMGRRDWPIARVVGIGCFASLLPYAGRMAVQAAIDGQDFPTALAAQVWRSLQSLEIGMFLVTLGVFVTMLGWTSTPVLTPPDVAKGGGDKT